MRDDGGTGPLTHVSGRMGSKDPVGIAGCKATPAVILPNQLPGNPQRDHMMNSDPSNMSTVALRLAGGCAGIWRRQARRPKGGRPPLNAR